MKHLLYIFIIISIAFAFTNCSSDNDTEGLDYYDTTEAGGDIDNNDNQGGLQPEPGMITAGEWCDLENWDFWTSLIQDNQYYTNLQYWEMYPVHRYELKLLASNGNPVIDASVALFDNNNEKIWATRTDNKGIAQLWNKFDNNNNNAHIIKINHNGSDATVININPYEQGTITYQFDVTNNTENNIDIMFVVDATGSMGDEIDFLKAELLDVINRVKNENVNSNLRLGSVFYRDDGDEYVVKNFNLTNDITSIYNSVNQQDANGGGDFPEAVDQALETAITQQTWNPSAVSRLLFLILDAPPHYYSNVLDKLNNQISLAAEKGIKIIPVSASGIDKETEFLLRIMAMATNGTYVFITNDSGIGNNHIDPTIGQYEVEYLNDLLVRLINKYSQI